MENWEQLDLFGRPEISINKKIRLIELFAGYGSQAMALERMGVDFEHHFVCEFDEHAIRSYHSVHNTNYETSDIRNIHGEDLKITDKDKYCYIMTYSFPCTDLSLAGQQKGMSKGSGTRSSLLWEIERILNELVEMGSPLPDILLMENVPQVVSEKFMPDFDEWLKFLFSIGYYSTYQILNARDYGVAQNRERCFMFSFLGEDFKYTFPNPIALKKKLKDYLEPVVDEKYYLKSEKAQQLIDQLIARGVLEEEETEQNRTEQNRTEQNNCGQLTSLSTIQKSSQLQTVLPQEKTGESVLNSQREPALLNYRRVDEIGNETAKTLMARDYKGFGSGFDVQNGVIEMK